MTIIERKKILYKVEIVLNNFGFKTLRDKIKFREIIKNIYEFKRDKGNF